MRKKQCGFTLIEIMMVVIIIGILTAIAVPAYSDYLIRSRITHATSGLAERRVRMEQFFQDNHNYFAAPACATDNSGTYFNFTAACPATAADAAVYTLTATGKSSMTGFTYTIDQNNLRQTPNAGSGWATSTTCWVTSKGGGC